MALISCPECHQQVSDSAKTCPHCGKDLTPLAQVVAPAVNKIMAVVLVVIIIIICASLPSCMGMCSTGEESADHKAYMKDVQENPGKYLEQWEKDDRKNGKI